MDLGRMDEAEKVYRQLIDRNPENIGYYDKLEICLGLGEGTPFLLLPFFLFQLFIPLVGN